MKRKIGIGLVIVMMLAGLVGCAAGKLEEEDFKLYDKDGKELEIWEDMATNFKTQNADEGDHTSRGIVVGSTLEELKEAYKDVWNLVNSHENDATGNTIYWFSGYDRSLHFMVEPHGDIVGIALNTSLK